MSDEVGKGSLKDFLAQRAQQKAQTSVPPEPKHAPEPKVESKPEPKPVPTQEPAQPRVTNKPPGLLRRLASDAVAEALRDTGAVQSFAAGKVVGRGRTVVSKGGFFSSDGRKANLSKPSALPKAPDLSTPPEDLEGLEVQVRKVDAEVKELGSYVRDELGKVRGDVQSVNLLASEALSSVQRMRKDLREEEFKRKVRGSRLSPGNDDESTGDQGLKKREVSSGGILDTITSYLKYGGAALSGGVGARVLGKLLGRSGSSKVATKATTDVLERMAAKEGSKVGAKALGGRVLGTIAKGKGSMIGTAASVLSLMKEDSQTGNHLRTKLRSLLGIEDPGEKWDLGGPDSGSSVEFDAVKAKVEESKLEEREEDPDKAIERDQITLKSKGDITLNSLRVITLESNDQINLTATNKIVIDAKRIEFKGVVQGLEGIQGTNQPQARKTIVNDPDLQRAQTQYDEDVEKYGKDKADELLSTRDRSPLSLDGLGGRVSNFLSGKGFRTTESRVSREPTHGHKHSEEAPSKPYDPSSNPLIAKDGTFISPKEAGMKNGRIPEEAMVSIGGGHKLAPETAANYRAMTDAAAKDGIDLNPKTDSYRNYEAQVDVARRKGLYSQGGLAATPGHSNHGFGMALDLKNMTPEKQAWLQKNGAKYGFHNIAREPWHYEYRGDGPIKRLQDSYLAKREGGGSPDGVPAPTGGEVSSPTLAAQRAEYKKELDEDPELKKKVVALASAEEGDDAQARRAMIESLINRAKAKGLTLKETVSPAYYEPFQNGSYDKHLAKVESNPKYRAEVEKDLNQVIQGSNESNLATDNASGSVKANSKTNQTMTFEAKNGEGFFRKDVRPDVHGAGNVEKIQNWTRKTQAALDDERRRAEEAKAQKKAEAEKVDEKVAEPKPEKPVEVPNPNPDAEPVIPKPTNLDDWNKEGAGPKLTESIKAESKPKEEAEKPKEQPKEEPKSEVTSTSAPAPRESKREHHHITAPVNHPESEPPRPGSDGYGDKVVDPDNCGGLCGLS